MSNLPGRDKQADSAYRVRTWRRVKATELPIYGQGLAATTIRLVSSSGRRLGVLYLLPAPGHGEDQ